MENKINYEPEIYLFNKLKELGVPINEIRRDVATSSDYGSIEKQKRYKGFDVNTKKFVRAQIWAHFFSTETLTDTPDYWLSASECTNKNLDAMAVQILQELYEHCNIV